MEPSSGIADLQHGLANDAITPSRNDEMPEKQLPPRISPGADYLLKATLKSNKKNLTKRRTTNTSAD
jgi:hypothetical protein